MYLGWVMGTFTRLSLHQLPLTKEEDTALQKFLHEHLSEITSALNALCPTVQPEVNQLLIQSWWTVTIGVLADYQGLRKRDPALRATSSTPRRSQAQSSQTTASGSAGLVSNPSARPLRAKPGPSFRSLAKAERVRLTTPMQRREGDCDKTVWNY
ncbi:hypothetical protein T439DRAFT_216495 [Meredithblackwellia eburnea MCA 4105]